MKQFCEICMLFLMILIGMFYNSTAEAIDCATGKPQIAIDGSNKIAAVWEASDFNNQSLTIQATYGNEFPVDMVEITDPKLFQAQNPLIAASSSKLATTKAAATWISRDLTTKNKVIQATILTSLGWNMHPVTLSLNDGSEQVSKDHKITISSDGMTIVTSWTSYFPSLKKSHACCSFSTNGGLTWSKPVKLKMKVSLPDDQKLTVEQ